MTISPPKFSPTEQLDIIQEDIEMKQEQEDIEQHPSPSSLPPTPHIQEQIVNEPEEEEYII